MYQCANWSRVINHNYKHAIDSKRNVKIIIALFLDTRGLDIFAFHCSCTCMSLCFDLLIAHTCITFSFISWKKGLVIIIIQIESIYSIHLQINYKNK